MHRHIIFLVIFFLLANSSGCSDQVDVDMKPMLAPAENRDAEANKTADWQPTPQQLSTLDSIKENCSGDLAKLLDHARWSGHRLRVTGMSGGLPVTENIGPWHIILVPTADKSVVEIKGLLFAKGFSVKIDMDRDVLIVNNSEFQGESITGNSPMFQNAGFKGVDFKRNLGLVMGSAAILFLDDGRLVMDFHKIRVNGIKAGEYGVLKPSIK